jgi:RNA polymerase primary sigma factor
MHSRFMAEALASAQLEPFVAMYPDQFIVDLAALARTRGLSFGLLDISVRGPLGRDNRFKLGLVPELVVDGQLNLAPASLSEASAERRSTTILLILQRVVADQLIRLPVNLPTPQLAWTLNDGAHIWQQHSLACPVAWIEQAADPRLMIRATGTCTSVGSRAAPCAIG